MKFAVIVFPGSNCDLDMYWAMKEIMGADCEYVRYDADSLEGCLLYTSPSPRDS